MKILSKHSYRNSKIALIASMVGAAGLAQAGDPLTLEVTVGTDTSPGVCGVDTTLTVDPGTDVNFCYTVTNNSGDTFETHTLDTNFFGLLLDNVAQTLGPTESFQFNDVQTIGSTTSLLADWDAAATLPSYTVDDTLTFDFTDISGTGTALGLGDDDEAGVTLPFNFTLFTLSSADITIGDNGAIRLGTLSAQIFAGNQSVTADTGNNLIAPHWDDLNNGAGGETYWEVQGVAPNQVAIIQWNDVPHFGIGTDGVTFQIKLFEGTNVIEFHYSDVSFGDPSFDSGASATVGIGGDAANAEYSFNTASLSDSLAISFTPGPPATEAASNSALVVVNAPDIDTPQSSLDFSQNPDVVDNSGNLEIDNLGTFVLNWNLEEQVAGARQFSRMPSLPDPKKPDANASAAALPASAMGASVPTKPAVQAFLGGGSIAYALRPFPDNPPSLTRIDLAAPAGVAVVNASTDYASTFAGDFYGNDYNTLYALSNAANPDLRLIRIDTVSGDSIDVGPAPATGTETWSGMTWDRTTGDMYAVSTDAVGSSLFTIDVNTGATNLIGAIGIPLVIDVAADIDGNLYGVAIGTDELVGIDKVTGLGTSIGPTNFDSNFAQGMDFDLSTNTLYWATCFDGGNCGDLRTIDLGTGNSTSVGQLGGAIGEYVAFAIATDVACGADIPWLSLATTSGSTDPAMTSNVGVTVDSTGLAFGDYAGDICVRSDDPDEPTKVVPVNLNVNDIIFADGFDGTN
ncbi:hypothetical protein [Marinicella meishanensis]|uniref:hypothetical protein n=1 Tax=Marinicella meishanensis TaxID=2873263 RepID=UPI001CBBE294|nr:hypothetical protein [Marinicella sp. NBU2979]